MYFVDIDVSFTECTTYPHWIPAFNDQVLKCFN